ncbi:Protein of unknown function DUF4193 [Acidimicrobiia bacterium]
MADDSIDEEEFEEVGLEEVLAAEDLDDDAIDDDLVAIVVGGDDGDDEIALVDDDEDEEEVGTAAKRDDDDDDEEEVDPDDVEADLDAILKDRIAAADDDEEEDEEVVPETKSPAEVAEGVTPKKANEFTCTGCFLLVNRGQFGPAEQMTCPVGESDCPAIKILSAPPKVVKSTKSVKPVKAVAKATKKR